MADLFGATSPSRASGSDIRARIDANRARRLQIAEAMKAEAGVDAHEVWGGDGEFSGLAFLETGLIKSPEGRKIVELWTVAHECGHIFLHRRGTPGFHLPSHVKEMEADQYTHQCFVEYGMRVPKRLRRASRAYIASWIVKDRAMGVPIDPRVEDYVRGLRSPYDPLREVPSTWRLHRASSRLSKLRRALRGRVFSNDPPSLGHELRGLPMFLWSRFARGVLLTTLVLAFMPSLVSEMNWIRPVRLPHVGLQDVYVAAVGGLIWTCAGMMWRTLRR